MTFDFNAVKEWIWDKFAEVSAKIKLRKKLNEIEELAENAGKAVRSGWKRFFTKKPAKQVIYKKEPTRLRLSWAF